MSTLSHPARATDGDRLRAVATRLATHGSDRDPDWIATVERWVEDASTGFTGARIQTYVPLLVEHIVRDRIAATTAAQTTST
ncbi:three-helix bundle dimerization domain-containing protein [Nocardioides sp. AX2bis]|uniref:three-helix bundle dimerization domain-containing protein n=1 Tax=Nocardioides sp. AX2bis TaxID=2653157 RepID=UPI0012F25C0A|nr:hypothetical protein [Nocardioides sp. AX2bis]VXB76695.1 hypothetical protein NOCARDAX2BIS_340037 [Nocardioides sp. AX2bis]